MTENVNNLKRIRKRVDALLSERLIACRRLQDEQQALFTAQIRLETALEAQDAVQTVSEAVQRQAHSQIADVVTRCLAAVFEQPYTFQIIFERKRNKTEARLVFTKDGVVMDEPTESAGGGVVDVAAFALRLSCLMLAKPPLRRLLVLDEPMKFLSKEYRPRIRSLIEKLSEELDIQIILVSHDSEFQIGEVIEIT